MNFEQFKNQFNYLAEGDVKFLKELWQQYQYLYKNLGIDSPDLTPAEDKVDAIRFTINECSTIPQSFIETFKRKTVIDKDDILDLKILLNSPITFEQFLEQI